MPAFSGLDGRMDKLKTTKTDTPHTAPASTPHRHRRIWPWMLLVLLVLAAGVGLRQPWKHGGGTGGPPGAPPGGGGSPGAASAATAGQSVSVAAATIGAIPITRSSLGTVTSLATVTIKSQLSGYLMSLPFQEGQIVKRGDLLAQVDPRPYQALLKQYQGQLAKDQALLDNAQLDLQRYRRLIKQDSTSQQTLDTAAATVREYLGTVQADQAQIDTEQLNIAYCHITSPINGRVGLRAVDIGNYVTASDTDGIVVVTQTDPISVVFTLPEDDIQPVLARMRKGETLTVTAYDRANTKPLRTGTLNALDSEIDTSTGTVKLRAMFANGEERLFPNQFVNVVLLLDTLRDAVVVPTRAIQTGTPGTYLYVLNGNSTVSLRKVSVGPAADGMTAISSGLKAGERVVVDGIDHLTDGAAVTVSQGESMAETGDTKATQAP